MSVGPYSGWRPRSMRFSKSKHEAVRDAKRARIGKRADRALYRCCKAHKRDPENYARLCVRANRLVYNRDTVAVRAEIPSGT